jgi:ABC-type cobalamin transport system permease subunit
LTLEDILKLLLGQVGLLVALLVVLWSGSRGYWVYGWYAKELRDRNTKLELRVERILGAAERGTSLAVRTAKAAGLDSDPDAEGERD